MEEAGRWRSHPWKQPRWTEERHLDRTRCGMHLLMVDPTWAKEMRWTEGWVACCLPVGRMNCRVWGGRRRFTGGGVGEWEGWDESSGWLSERPADIPRWGSKKKELWEIDIIGVRARSHGRGEWESGQAVGKTRAAASSTPARANSIVVRGNIRASAYRHRSLKTTPRIHALSPVPPLCSPPAVPSAPGTATVHPRPHPCRTAKVCNRIYLQRM